MAGHPLAVAAIARPRLPLDGDCRLAATIAIAIATGRPPATAYADRPCGSTNEHGFRVPAHTGRSRVKRACPAMTGSVGGIALDNRW
ncbi:hypothetical protein GCM10027445_05780 [Amycolatopsis endophytica]